MNALDLPLHILNALVFRPHGLVLCRREQLVAAFEKTRKKPTEKPEGCTGHLVHNEYDVCPVHDR